MRLIKVLWQHCGVEEATWEREDTIRANYPFLFEDRGMFFFFFLSLKLKWLLHMHVYTCLNFGDEVLLRGEKCKTREKFNFFEKMAKR